MSDQFSTRRITGASAILPDGAVLYTIESSYEMTGPAIDVLRDLVARIEGDTPPGDIARITLTRYELARSARGDPIYRFDVDVESVFDAGKVIPDLR